VGEVEWNYGNVFPFDIFPDIQFCLMKQRMDADVGPFFEIGLELVPQFRRLVFDVPFYVFVTWTEVTFLGARRFFVAAHPDNDPREMMLFEDLLQTVFLEGAATFDSGRL